MLLEELVKYMSECDWEQRRALTHSIRNLVNLFMPHLQGRDADLSPLGYERGKDYEGELPKLIFNVFYEVYALKSNSFDLRLLEEIHQNVEYYARRRGMLGLVTACCMEMGRIYGYYCQHGEASEQYEKALQLAVVQGDKYTEEVAIDKLGLSEYYRGDIVRAQHMHRSLDKLSSYDRRNITESYSNDLEIHKILDVKGKEKSP